MTRTCSRHLLGLMVLAAVALGCGTRRASLPPAPAPPALIEELKAFGETLGIARTANFLRSSPRTSAVTRCYFTDRLELPASYGELRMIEESDAACAARGATYDVFFYPAEAVASGAAPVTRALAEARVERILVVVPHEDFHNQVHVQGSPAEIDEAAATLAGFLAAHAFAEDKYGPESARTASLSRDAQLFLHKARIVNRYYERLQDLYGSVRSGAITREVALATKAELFANLSRECTALTPEPASFNKCPAAMNNAALSFDRTYTLHYPVLYELFVLLDEDTKATIAHLTQLARKWPAADASAADLMRAVGQSVP